MQDAFGVVSHVRGQKLETDFCLATYVTTDLNPEPERKERSLEHRNMADQSCNCREIVVRTNVNVIICHFFPSLLLLRKSHRGISDHWVFSILQ